jgi:hypothetical protein
MTVRVRCFFSRRRTFLYSGGAKYNMRYLRGPRGVCFYFWLVDAARLLFRQYELSDGREVLAFASAAKGTDGTTTSATHQRTTTRYPRQTLTTFLPSYSNTSDGRDKRSFPALDRRPTLASSGTVRPILQTNSATSSGTRGSQDLRATLTPIVTATAIAKHHQHRRHHPAQHIHIQ